jgi:hypothetical protein
MYPSEARRLLMAILISLVVPIGAPANGQPASDTAPDVQKLGPQIGAHVPDFSLPDQSGLTHTLASVMGPKGAMLVFFRSADW